VTFESLVKEGVELHDRADKRKNNDPSGACAIFREAIAKYHAAQEVKPEGQSSLDLSFNLGAAYGAIAQVLKNMDTRNSAQQVEEYLGFACDQYAEVLEQDEAHTDALNNLASALTTLAERRQGEESVKLFREGCEMYEKASSLNPSDFEAACNHGDALVAWAEKTFDSTPPNPHTIAEVNKMLEAAYQRYLAAIGAMTYDCDRVDALCNWANALTKHAEIQTKVGDMAGAATLHQAAAQKLAEMLAKTPTDPSGHVALAEAHKSFGEVAPEQEEGALASACASFRAALKIDANYPDALAGLAEALLDVGRLQLRGARGEEALPNLTEAGELCFRYLQANGGDVVAGYNMACICALLGREAECQTYLAQTARVEQGNGADMVEWATGAAADADFAAFVATPWFQSMLAQFLTAPAQPQMLAPATTAGAGAISVGASAGDMMMQE